MYIKSKGLTPVNINEHPLGHLVKDAITSGKAIASAPPLENQEIQWTDDNKQRLKQAIRQMAKAEGIPIKE